MSTIQKMYLVVKGMVTEMCDREKERMKAMDQTKLGSWSKAVICADGTWQTRGFHSKNGTFTIRNYHTGALLYFTHLCQKGTITSELYKGTSKSMEGYGATQLMRKAKEEGLNIKVHWQDADSSASKYVKEYYPDAEIMICGGHAGKDLKQLQIQAKRRKFDETLTEKNSLRSKALNATAKSILKRRKHPNNQQALTRKWRNHQSSSTYLVKKDVDASQTPSAKKHETASLTYCRQANQPQSSERD